MSQTQSWILKDKYQMSVVTKHDVPEFGPILPTRSIFIKVKRSSKFSMPLYKCLMYLKSCSRLYCLPVPYTHLKFWHTCDFHNLGISESFKFLSRAQSSRASCWRKWSTPRTPVTSPRSSWVWTTKQGITLKHLTQFYY